MNIALPMPALSTEKEAVIMEHILKIVILIDVKYKMRFQTDAT